MAESTAHTYRLRTLLLWLMVVLVVPTLVLGVIAAERSANDSRLVAERRVLGLASELVRTVDATLERTTRRLQAIAEAPSLEAGDLAAFRTEVMRYLPSEPAWESVILSESDGRQLVNTGRELHELLESAADPGSLARVVETRRPVIGSLRTGPRGQSGFVVRVPVLRGEGVRYVLSALITPDRLSAVLPFRTADRDWLRVVMNSDNVIVARSRAPEQWVGTEASPEFAAQLTDADELIFQSETLDGQQVYSGVSRSRLTGWRGIVAVPHAVLDAEFRGTRILLATAGILLLGLGGLASYSIARWISRDIKAVSNAASALMRGERIEATSSRVAEVRQLSDALIQSGWLIRKREQERDVRVEQADAARAEAEKAAKAKDDFLAMLGHELRNPLAPVLNALHVAETTGGVLADRERRIVERQVRHMARLVDDLLDMARLHRGALDLHVTRCRLRPLVEEAVEMTRVLFEEQRQVLSVDVPADLEIDCDRDRVTQVLVNLLANAAKYTPSGGAVILSARLDDDEVVIMCEDNGMGLKSELLGQVFLPFVQGARGIDRRQGGLGLGLAVARGLVEQHGGAISAQSEGEGRGSRFIVRLPARHDSSMDRPDAAPPQRPQTSVRVLVVEDNEDAREMLVLALSMSGVDARGAGTGARAVEMVRDWRPQVAVLDIGLPDMDGYQLARELRTLPGGDSLLLMALTGYGGEASAAEARGSGFDRFFVKPVGVEALLDAIARADTDV